MQFNSKINEYIYINKNKVDKFLSYTIILFF